MAKIFADHVSTTPLDERVFAAMRPYFSEIYGNPSSHVHEQGVLASKGIDTARAQVAALVEADPARVIFVSGATEANNLALLGGLPARPEGRTVVLVGEIEHYSLLNCEPELQARGYTLKRLRVDENGVVGGAELLRQLSPEVALVSVALANPEIGAIAPVAELAALAHRFGAYFHTDATAGVGLLPFSLTASGVDVVTLSAHNIYGPKGVGALITRGDFRVRARQFGGFQEAGLRSGTENVPGIVGFGAAAQLAKSELEARAAALRALQAKLFAGLQSLPFIHFTGPTDLAQRLPGHVSFWVEHIEGESLILLLNVRGIMAASGSACSSNLKAEDEDGLVASHVLSAVGVPSDICAGSVTLSLGVENTSEDVERILAELPPIVARLLEMSPTYADYQRSNQKGNEHG